MSKIRTKHTGPELLLRKYLTAFGLRYRLHSNGLPGHPDIVFPTQKLVVFCDGEFWHGRYLARRLRNGQFKVRKGYWVAKIQSNRARDRRNDRALRAAGWTVMRFWCTEIGRWPAQIAFIVFCHVRGVGCPGNRSKGLSGTRSVLAMLRRSRRTVPGLGFGAK